MVAWRRRRFVPRRKCHGFENPDGRQVAGEKLNLHLRDLAGRTLRQFRSADVAGQDIGIAMDADGVFHRGILWLEPCAGGKLHHARHDVFTDDSASETAAALIKKPDDVAVRYSTGRSVGRMDADRFPIPDLGRTAEISIVQLAVQTLIRLIADEMQGMEAGIIGRLHSWRIPARMTFAIIISEALDSL